MFTISQDSIHSHETKVKRHIAYGVGCMILDHKYFGTKFSTSKVLAAEIQVILKVYLFNFPFSSHQFQFFINIHEIETPVRFIN